MCPEITYHNDHVTFTIVFLEAMFDSMSVSKQANGIELGGTVIIDHL